VIDDLQDGFGAISAVLRQAGWIVLLPAWKKKKKKKKMGVARLVLRNAGCSGVDARCGEPAASRCSSTACAQEPAWVKQTRPRSGDVSSRFHQRCRRTSRLRAFRHFLSPHQHRLAYALTCPAMPLGRSTRC